MSLKAIFAGSFDPFTCGHEDVVRRALLVFDSLVVAVADSSPQKKPLLSLADRTTIIQEALIDCPNVAVIPFSGLIAEFAKQQSIHYLVRGIRHGGEFEYERQMAVANRQLSPKLDTFFVMPSSHVATISSSLVREIFTNGGDITAFVPASSAKMLASKSSTCR